jgi:hypothetical protein
MTSRTFELWEAGHRYDKVQADSIEQALHTARCNVDRGNYPDSNGTLYIDIRAIEVLDEEDDEREPEEATGTVTLEPAEPVCEGDRVHEWESPLGVVGGIAENPGVWGKGGGVVIREVCMHCGQYRITDTWAQRRDTGEQGVRAVSYEQADARSREWINSRTKEEA